MLVARPKSALPTARAQSRAPADSLVGPPRGPTQIPTTPAESRTSAELAMAAPSTSGHDGPPPRPRSAPGGRREAPARLRPSSAPPRRSGRGPLVSGLYPRPASSRSTGSRPGSALSAVSGDSSRYGGAAPDARPQSAGPRLQGSTAGGGGCDRYEAPCELCAAEARAKAREEAEKEERELAELKPLPPPHAPHLSASEHHIQQVRFCQQF